jgi:hypothetical protein
VLEMIADVRQLLRAGPFEAFSIVTTNGSRYLVASADHASINPQATRVVIWFDDEGSVTLSGFHISALAKAAPRNAKAA